MASRTQQRTTFGHSGGATGGMNRTARIRPAETIILERRRQEGLRATAKQIVDSDHQLGIRHQWEATTTRRLQQNRATRRLAELSTAEEAKLEARRGRLRALLADEERLLLAEAAATVETTLDRQAKMRDRIKSLRETRETERQQIAEAKKQELFLRNCDPVRVVQQQQNLQAVVAAREEQLQIKQRRHQHEQAVDRMYDQLWLEDKRAKDAKAQRDAETAKQRTLAQHDVLVQQRTAVEEAREREQVFKMEEERLRQQEAELMVQEQQREQEQALRKRQQMRSELNAHNKQEIQRKQAQQQAELEDDIKLLKDVLAAAEGEDEVQTNNRRRMAHEMQLYLQYVQDMKAQKAEFEQAVEHFHRQEAEKAMQRTQAKLDREQAARDILMQEVMATRHEQVASKLHGVEQERLEAAKEFDELMQAVEAHDRMEAEEKAVNIQRQRQHAAMLQQQASSNRRLRQEEEQQIEADARRLRDQDLAFENKVKDQLLQLSVSGKRV